MCLFTVQNDFLNRIWNVSFYGAVPVVFKTNYTSGLVGAREEISHSLAEVLTFYSRIFPYNFEYLALRFSVGFAQV